MTKLSNWVSGILIVGLLGGAIVMGFLEQGGGIADGVDAPAFSFEKFGGGRVTSDQLRGKVVMLDFWATWCPPCIEEMPYLVKIAKEYEARGVAFVAVSRDEPEDAEREVRRFLEEREPGLAPFVAFSDSEAGTRFGVRALPTMYILGRDGRILGSQTGQVSERKVRRWLDEALKAP